MFVLSCFTISSEDKELTLLRFKFDQLCFSHQDGRIGKTMVIVIPCWSRDWPKMHFVYWELLQKEKISAHVLKYHLGILLCFKPL